MERPDAFAAMHARNASKTVEMKVKPCTYYVKELFSHFK